jgi:hypothetical protein
VQGVDEATAFAQVIDANGRVEQVDAPAVERARDTVVFPAILRPPEGSHVHVIEKPDFLLHRDRAGPPVPPYMTVENHIRL